MLLEQELKQRNLPKIFEQEQDKQDWSKRQRVLLAILEKNMYGKTPPAPQRISAKITETDEIAYAGKATQEKIEVSFDTPKGEFSFPVNLLVPNGVEKPPVILHIAFRPQLPDRYVPTEEIIDGGFALAHFCYEDVVPDTHDGSFEQGLTGCYQSGKARRPDEWGKIGAWAFAASRVMDYLQTLDKIDKAHIAVMGHSRLGKTALWCGAQDERFFAVISNDSGKGGSAVWKDSTGEKIKAFLDYGSWDWFCENFKSFDRHENQMPFDQHFLLALIAPRYLYVASAENDFGADPRSELISCVAVDEVYRLLCCSGIEVPEEFPAVPFVTHTGKIGYHIRRGGHFLSRYDWNQYMSFLREKINLK